MSKRRGYESSLGGWGKDINQGITFNSKGKNGRGAEKFKKAMTEGMGGASDGSRFTRRGKGPESRDLEGKVPAFHRNRALAE